MASSATPIQNFADTIASVFVPTVTLLSVLTMVSWYAACRLGFVPADWYGSAANPESAFTFSLLFGIAVLVISCPCALGLATPTAIMVRALQQKSSCRYGKCIPLYVLTQIVFSPFVP
jgi:P-type Cu+ transporter